MLPYRWFHCLFSCFLTAGSQHCHSHDFNCMKGEKSSDMLIVIYVYGNSEISALRIKRKEKGRMSFTTDGRILLTCVVGNP